MYILLTGEHPFAGRNDDKKSIIDKLQNADIFAESLKNPKLSTLSKDLLKKLCKFNAMERYEP
jgi:serine/threonine protein kinase